MHFHDDLLDSDASVSYSSPPQNCRKICIRATASMQIFLNLIENFSFIYAFVTFLRVINLIDSLIDQQISHYSL